MSMLSAIKNVAAGFIIYRETKTKGVEYLLLKTSYGSHHWTPPKGHVDPGETEFTAAVRETEEEAGLIADNYEIIKGFKETLQYQVKGKPKLVVYWLAKLLDPDTPIILSEEHTALNWGDLEKTKELSRFSEMNDCFDKAHAFLFMPKTMDK